MRVARYDTDWGRPVPDRIVKNSRHVPVALKFKIWAMPCAICGIPYQIHCDHITPWSAGGSNAESNLQPLCRWCNAAKKNRLNNTQLRALILRRGKTHFLRAVYLEDTKYFNAYEGPSMAQWEQHRPDRVAFALELYEAFIA